MGVLLNDTELLQLLQAVAGNVRAANGGLAGAVSVGGATTIAFLKATDTSVATDVDVTSNGG